ncbi:MAG: ATP-binding protein [Candidatus Aminicenantes bacterium]|nr:ATP-binding protein [Candidatus Aminicenantes bacterium]
MKENRLLSMDVESYLHKAAVFSQRSSLLYSTELIKTAFKRGADNINIIIDQNKTEISDNGSGIDPGNLNMLAELKNKNAPVERKEAAVRRLRGDYGAGLLAVFASEPKSIKIETVSGNEGYILSINDEEVLLEEGTSLDKGTKILISRRSRDYKKEIKIVREYLRWSGKKIILNGNEIITEKIIPDTLVSVKVGDKNSAVTGMCGIPSSGGMCRIWFTENGIIRKKMDFPPFRGLIFSAVLETAESEWSEVHPIVVPYIYKLYDYLGKKYPKLISEHKNRVEELMFLHTRKTGERKFTEIIKPFHVSGSNTFIGLEELINLSNSGKLYVISSDYDKSDLSYKNSEFTIELSPRQIDFVMNHLRIPAKMIAATMVNKKRLSFKIFLNIQRLKYRITSKLKIFTKKLENDQLWNEERALISRLGDYFRNDLRGYTKISFHIIKCIGFAPVYFRTGGSGIIDSELEIYLRRGSRIVRRMVKLNDIDKSNFELITALINAELSSVPESKLSFSESDSQ